jgi:integrase
VILNERQQAPIANRRTHLTESEVLAVLELARATDARAWAIFALSFNHGLRVTEALNLRLDSINLADRTVSIERLKHGLDSVQPLEEMRGKPALSDLAALKAYLKVRVEDGSSALFTGQKGPLKRWTLTRMFREYCEKVSVARVALGLAPIAENAMHFHTLRHSIATIMASRVDNIFHVKSHLGHVSIGSTMVYCASNPKLSSKAAHEALSEAFSNL